MPRQKTPLGKAKLTGAAAKNPQRYRDRVDPETSGRPVGRPPKTLPENAATYWKIYISELPWLVFEDRAMLTLACILRTQVEAGGPDVTASIISNYRSVLASLGASPADRNRVKTGEKQPESDPFEAFSRPN